MVKPAPMHVQFVKVCARMCCAMFNHGVLLHSVAVPCAGEADGTSTPYHLYYCHTCQGTRQGTGRVGFSLCPVCNGNNPKVKQAPMHVQCVMCVPERVVPCSIMACLGVAVPDAVDARDMACVLCML